MDFERLLRPLERFSFRFSNPACGLEGRIMNSAALSVLSGLTLLPYLALIAILAHFTLRRANWKRSQRQGKACPAFCPSFSALGAVLLFAQIFYRPTIFHVAEVRQEENADEDDQGDPENPQKLFHRQLRRIRRGEPVEQLILRI